MITQKELSNLFLSAIDTDDIKLMRKLLDLGIDLNYYSSTYLYRACHLRKELSIKFLIENGVDTIKNDWKFRGKKRNKLVNKYNIKFSKENDIEYED